MKLIFYLWILGISLCWSQNQFQLKTPIMAYSIDNGAVMLWHISQENKQNVLQVACSGKKHKISLSDGQKTQTFVIKKGQKITLKATLNDFFLPLELHGVDAGVHFSKQYIKQHKGKALVKIPPVFELVNVLMALHPHAGRDHNLFDSQSDYFQKVKTYFSPYQNHPAIDTINKYLGIPRLDTEKMRYLFPMQAYDYHYALKMNAVSYDFDNHGRIVFNGQIKQVGQDWMQGFDPMKDISIFEDFAKKSRFQEFYKENENYYQELLSSYQKLNPIDKMVDWLTQKFDFSYESFLIYFSPLNQGAQATTQFEQKGFKQTFMFVSKVKNEPEYTQAQNELFSSWILFTEIDHNFVNPLSNKMLKQINSSFASREKWALGEITQAYPDPYSVFNEYMTFALFSLYAYDHYSKEDLDIFLPNFEEMMQNTRGFIRFKDFNRALLKFYSENKKTSAKDWYHFIFSSFVNQQ